MSRPAARRRLLRASLAVLAVLVVRRAYQHLALLCRHLHLSTWLLRALGSSAPPLSPLADECELSSELSDEIRSLGAAGGRRIHLQVSLSRFKLRNLPPPSGAWRRPFMSAAADRAARYLPHPPTPPTNPRLPPTNPPPITSETRLHRSQPEDLPPSNPRPPNSYRPEPMQGHLRTAYAAYTPNRMTPPTPPPYPPANPQLAPS